MKTLKTSKLIILFSLLIILGSTKLLISSEIKQKEEKPLKIIFITTCVGEDFFKPVKKGMNDAAELMGVECSFIGTEEVDVKEQAEMVNMAIKDGADGIALNIIDPIAFDKVVENAIKKGVPVVAFNVDDNKTPNARLSSVCQNLFKAGEELGKKIADDIPANSTVLATMHNEGISALEDRLAGIQNALKNKNLKCKVVITGVTAEKSSQVISDVLKANPEIKTILCTGQADTEGAGIAIEKHFSDQNILAAGFDLSPLIVRHIKNGHLVFTVDQQPYMQGFYPVIQLVQYLRYGIMPSNNEIGAAFVTRDNVDKVERLINEGYR